MGLSWRRMGLSAEKADFFLSHVRDAEGIGSVS